MSDIPRYPGGAPEPSSPAPPLAVQNAAKLMYVGAALALAGFIYSVSSRSQIKRDVINANPHASTTSVNHTVNQILVVAVISGLIGVGLWLWMAEMNKRGRSWARVVASVFFGFDTLGLLVGLSQSTPALSKAASVLTWVVGLGAIVLLWRPESSAFFSAARYRD